jgi:hypothetical protein
VVDDFEQLWDLLTSQYGVRGVRPPEAGAPG